MKPPPQLLRIPEIARELQVGDDNVRRLIWSNQLNAHRILGQFRIARKDFDNYLARARAAVVANPRRKNKKREPSPAGSLP
jgi:excisionase family DNA binding protein